MSIYIILFSNMKIHKSVVKKLQEGGLLWDIYMQMTTDFLRKVNLQGFIKSEHEWKIIFDSANEVNLCGNAGNGSYT